MIFTVCDCDALVPIHVTNNPEALFKHRWEERMEDTLRLRKLVANGPFPAMRLWHSASSALMEDLQLIEPASLPSTADYQNFVILSSPSDSPPAETFEEDPEDNIELCNEVGILDHLETRLHSA